ncbi:hypothetical protein EJB05_04774 [Eragrostis curvula]|uniref:Uncharacterized protein n=1 Tax=Eragrostis curvula TaxID=38414 RepID=A0A5J9W9B0_9POAL|nr:hypothetical protein EJB05_04774 [Eragrostis curvula]
MPSVASSWLLPPAALLPVSPLHKKVSSKFIRSVEVLAASLLRPPLLRQWLNKLRGQLRRSVRKQMM